MTKQLQGAYITVVTRSPIGKVPKGTLKNLHPDDLLATILKSAIAQVPNLDPALIEDAITDCAVPEAQQDLDVAHIGVLLAGLPNSMNDVTINHFCASGPTAVAMATDHIRVDESDVMIATSVEPMSMISMMDNSPSILPGIFTRDEGVNIAYDIGLTAEKVAQQWKISRGAQDAFSLASHQKALVVQQAGEFKDEITPIEIIGKFPNLDTGVIDIRTCIMSLDEGLRADTSVEGLGKLCTVFANKGSVTAGNGSQTLGGSGVLVLVSERILKQFNLVPLAHFVSFAMCGMPPKIIGIGPKEAIPAALKAGGLTQDQTDWIELNEAFAAQLLAVIQDLGLDASKVNPLGGAIALDHPLSATGAIRAATVVHDLRRHNQEYDMVTMCVGTGVGTAGIFERMWPHIRGKG